MTSIITSLVGIAKEAGVIFKYNHPVQQILIDSKNKKPQATGLIIDGKIHHHDIVISNADLPFTETQLIKEPRHQTYPLSYWKRKELAPSTFLIYLGVSGKVPELLHHNLFFRKDRDAGFDKIFGNHHTQLPQDPNIYVCCPSASDDSVAPEGDTNIFVLVPTPVHVYPDEQTRKSYAAEIISMIESSLDISIADRIVSQTIFDANEFVSEYHSFGGTALGLAHTLDQSAYWRPYIQSKKVSNLYYSG